MGLGQDVEIISNIKHHAQRVRMDKLHCTWFRQVTICLHPIPWSWLQLLGLEQALLKRPVQVLDLKESGYAYV